MRVLYVSKALTVAVYRDKVRELAGRADVTAVMPERWDGRQPEPSPVGVPEPERVPVRFPGHNHLHWYPDAARWLGASDPDLVHVDEEPYSLVTLQLGRLCVRRDVPFLFFAWQNLQRRLPPPFGHVRRAVFRGARAGIAGTAAAAETLRADGFDGPLAVIPQFGVDPQRFAPDPAARAASRRQLDVPPDAFLAAYAGRLVAEKGVHVLLDAVVRLRDVTPGAGQPPYLVFIGDGPERARLEDGARRAGAAAQVRFSGHLPSPRMPATLAACDALVLPSVGTASWTEQFGRVLVEAMACGVPVVGTRCGAIPEVIGPAGELVPPGDAAALADAIDRLRRTPGLGARRAREGRERVLAEYTQAKVAEETVAFYRRLVGAGEPAA